MEVRSIDFGKISGAIGMLGHQRKERWSWGIGWKEPLEELCIELTDGVPKKGSLLYHHCFRLSSGYHRKLQTIDLAKGFLGQKVILSKKDKFGSCGEVLHTS